MRSETQVSNPQAPLGVFGADLNQQKQKTSGGCGGEGPGRGGLGGGRGWGHHGAGGQRPGVSAVCELEKGSQAERACEEGRGDVSSEVGFASWEPLLPSAGQ